MKNRTIKTTIDLAQRTMKGDPLCMNVVSGRSLSEEIAIAEANEIAEQIVQDSRFYNY